MNSGNNPDSATAEKRQNPRALAIREKISQIRKQKTSEEDFTEIDFEDQEKKRIEERKRRMESIKRKYEGTENAINAKAKKLEIQDKSLSNKVDEAGKVVSLNTLDYSIKPAASVDLFNLIHDKSKTLEAVLKLDPSLHNNSTASDSWDDIDGYYKVTVGEKLVNKYVVIANLGKGVFSSVVKANLDDSSGQKVAIKIIRKNEVMYKAGTKELNILRKLKQADPDSQKHVIQLLGDFEYRGHLCLVFEEMHMNLREVLKKFGFKKGININAIQLYSYQLFQALNLLRQCEIIHSDIKPDNILVNESKTVLKLADLGSACEISENEITPYLVSRFYRAPEIILGLKYDYAIDMWSVACTLYELFSGVILFTGNSNNQMLKQIMNTKGRFPVKMLKKGQFTVKHFELTDNESNFLFLDQVSETGNLRKTPVDPKPPRDLRSLIWNDAEKERVAGSSNPEAEKKKLELFLDLLEKSLTLNAEKRLNPSEAVKHPFITFREQ